MSLDTLKLKVAAVIKKAQSGGNTDELEAIIDQSGVLDSTEGTVEEKVGALIDKTKLFNAISQPYFRGNTEITAIDIYLDKPYPYTQEVFYGCTNLKHIVGINTSKSTMSARMFYDSGIEIIDKPFDFSSQPSSSNFSPFERANYLKEVRIVPNTYKWTSTISSSALSDESIQSIIEGLADLAGKTAQTIRLPGVKAQLTTEQLATITSKNWNLA